MQETVCLFESSVAHHPLLLKNWCVEPVHLMCVESLWHLSVPLIKHRMRRNRNHPFSGSICGFCPISLVSALSEQNSICCFFSNKNNNKCPLLCNLVGLFCCFTWLCCFAVSLGCVARCFRCCGSQVSSSHRPSWRGRCRTTPVRQSSQSTPSTLISRLVTPVHKSPWYSDDKVVYGITERAAAWNAATASPLNPLPYKSESVIWTHQCQRMHAPVQCSCQCWTWRVNGPVSNMQDRVEPAQQTPSNGEHCRLAPINFKSMSWGRVQSRSHCLHVCWSKTVMPWAFTLVKVFV